jgi:His-Xaa-Ser system radical SAM maturase HxsB
MNGGAVPSSTPLPVLNQRFRPEAEYRARCGTAYALLPFRFIALDDDRHVLTNLAGEHLVVPKETTERLVRHRLATDDPVYDELKSLHFLMDGDGRVALELLAAKYRTKQSALPRFTSLFMFVTTLRCEHTCQYCQVSRQSEDRAAYDMTFETADRAVDFMFCSPSASLKVEFQGGESLLNFPVVRHVVERANARNAGEGRDLAFVVASNLAGLTDDHLAFCRAYDVSLSTSLDGPRGLHNRNRPKPGRDSYERAVAGIARARAALGHDRVAALMTTTAASLGQPRAIVDEYVRHGFTSIFLRPVSPYGFAVRTGVADEYTIGQWLEFYRSALAYIVELNLRGTPLVEEYSALVLRRMLTPFPTGYVDLQSPAGIGIAGLVFNYDGDVYASDESRMLAEMGDKTFRLGNLGRDSYGQIMGSDALLAPLRASMTEGVPMCSDCGFQPWCGSDPVGHYRGGGDFVGFKPTSDFCRKNMSVMRHLVGLLEDDPAAAAVLRSWALRS